MDDDGLLLLALSEKTAVFSLFTLIFLAVSAFLAHYGAKGRRMAGLIAKLETCPIGDASPGLVEVQGTIKPTGELLRSPMSGKDCVYFEFKVEEQRTRSSSSEGHDNTYWHTLVDDSQRAGFSVDDGTGSVSVAIAQADLLLSEDKAGHSSVLQNPTPEFKDAMARYGKGTKGWVFNRTLRYRETFLEPGDRLYVLGTFSGGRILKGAEGVLVVSDQGEAAVLSSFKSRALWSTVFALFFGGLALVLGFLAYRL